MTVYWLKYRGTWRLSDMKVIDEDFIYFMAVRESPEGFTFKYFLNKDYTVTELTGYNDIELKNIFNSYEAGKVLMETDRLKFEVREYVGDDFRGDATYEFRKVNLKFRPYSVNVKLSYFEEERLHG